MEHTSQPAELARRNEEHNDMRGGHGNSGPHEASQKIGGLAAAALNTGTSWTELNRLLATMEDAPPPAGLESNHPPVDACRRWRHGGRRYT